MIESASENLRRVIPTQICLPEEMIAALDARATHEKLFRGRSVIVRRAVAAYLAHADTLTPISPVDETADMSRWGDANSEATSGNEVAL